MILLRLDSYIWIRLHTYQKQTIQANTFSLIQLQFKVRAQSVGITKVHLLNTRDNLLFIFENMV